MRNCQQCQQPFEIFAEDLKFYALMEVPEPTQCPWCRMIRRLAFRNERNLYHRKCDLSGKQIISAYSPDKPFPVYENEAWWSDGWSALDYGRDFEPASSSYKNGCGFDFSRPFFEQFRELLNVVPRMARIQQNPIENSDYCNAISRSKPIQSSYSTERPERVLCEKCYFAEIY